MNAIWRIFVQLYIQLCIYATLSISISCESMIRIGSCAPKAEVRCNFRRALARSSATVFAQIATLLLARHTGESFAAYLSCAGCALRMGPKRCIQLGPGANYYIFCLATKTYKRLRGFALRNHPFFQSSVGQSGSDPIRSDPVRFNWL